MIIYVKVKPCSQLEYLEKLSENEYIFSTTERAQDGKANVAVIKMLSKELGVSFKDILIKNPKSRRKIIEIVK